MDGAAYIRPPAWAGRQVRFMTAGSVDDGKSTLIGRLLLDSKALMQDQADAVSEDDLASLTDGLEAERAQGITIDVAYRYFSTPSASFIIADAPGHERYTRNMVTAASVSDVVVIVVDAAQVIDGVLKPQTRRHAAIAALLNLDVIVAVNKMDVVGWAESRFRDVQAAFDHLAGGLGVGRVRYVPLSARYGDNVVNRHKTYWYDGPSLIELLQQAAPVRSLAERQLRLPIQLVLRDGARRLYAGRIESGALRVGDEVRIGLGDQTALVLSVSINGAPSSGASAGESVAIELDGEYDLASGHVIADAGVRYTQRAVADLCWLDEARWTPGRRYRLRQGTLETVALIERVRGVRDIETGREQPAEALSLNDIATVEVATRDPLLADLFADLPTTGAFVLFDADTRQTCAAGMIKEISV